MAETKSGLVTGDDGVTRCFWGDAPQIYRDYHDSEWGFPVHDDRRLFEKLCLEGFQAGLSWLTILRQRENFRAAFAGFDFERRARFGDATSSVSWATPGSFATAARSRRRSTTPSVLSSW